MVAPLAGAWVEIANADFSPWNSRSLPLRERGLKYPLRLLNRNQTVVAPLAGAWVEIPSRAGENMVYCRRSPCGSVG